jgi:hypothetical protein
VVLGLVGGYEVKRGWWIVFTVVLLDVSSHLLPY